MQVLADATTCGCGGCLERLQRVAAVAVWRLIELGWPYPYAESLCRSAITAGGWTPATSAASIAAWPSIVLDLPLAA